jgi:hypothetical protein
MSLPPLYLLHSADYELYLGGSHLSEQELLIDPTKKLLDCYDSLGIPTTLFVDVACLWRYRELGLDHFPDQVEEQLRDAVGRGHDVQSHLHPHWMSTRFKGGNYFFEPVKYLLGTQHEDLKECSALIREMLQRAKEMLTQLLQPVDGAYSCLAFRAGGYGLQPREQTILKILAELGYKIDSSIIPGGQFNSLMQQVDFSQVPNRANYWLSHSQGLSREAQEGEGLFEIPIPSFNAQGWDRLRVNGPEAIRRGWQILRGEDMNQPRRGRPCTIPEAAPQISRLKACYWAMDSRLKKSFHYLELGQDHRLLLNCVQNYLKPFLSGSKPIFFSLNCHPKGLDEGSLRTLRRFHSELTTLYDGEVKCITYQEAGQIIQEGREGADV